MCACSDHALVPFLFSFFYFYGPHRDLHSFPTRRSSDLHPASLKIVCRPSASAWSFTMWLPGTTMTRGAFTLDRKSTRLNSSHLGISYAVFCLKKKKKNITPMTKT